MILRITVAWIAISILTTPLWWQKVRSHLRWVEDE